MKPTFMLLPSLSRCPMFHLFDVPYRSTIEAFSPVKPLIVSPPTADKHRERRSLKSCHPLCIPHDLSGRRFVSATVS